ncbi:signal peptidase I [Microbacterium sp. KUDC0406]|uniref:signal peptidase I n=1 Tax=Microbacterium sp. KUDC0406 TaxID=2909588 RepID=UPI001F1F6497|nr:signal peptidase I [Microbacterium sp. KUDC0406]UJP10267.1 signal peptidase I [Microbacterium sp. KUDC0406]
MTVVDEGMVPADPAPRGGMLRALLHAVAVAILVVVLAVGALAVAVPAVTGSTALTVLTSSMEPHLPPGTMVVVRKTPVAEIETGMVMTYQLHSGQPTLITHRVTQVLTEPDGDRLFVTKGDNNAQADADPVQEVQVRGTVWYAIPYLGWVATAVTGQHRAVVLTVAVVALFGYAAWALGSGLRETVRRRSASARSAEAASV